MYLTHQARKCIVHLDKISLNYFIYHLYFVLQCLYFSTYFSYIFVYFILQGGELYFSCCVLHIFIYFRLFVLIFQQLLPLHIYIFYTQLYIYAAVCLPILHLYSKVYIYIQLSKYFIRELLLLLSDHACSCVSLLSM